MKTILALFVVLCLVTICQAQIPCTTCSPAACTPAIPEVCSPAMPDVCTPVRVLLKNRVRLCQRITTMVEAVRAQRAERVQRRMETRVRLLQEKVTACSPACDFCP